MTVEIYISRAATERGPATGAVTYHYSRASAVREAGRFAEIAPYVVDGCDDLDDLTISDDGTTYTLRERTPEPHTDAN